MVFMFCLQEIFVCLCSNPLMLRFHRFNINWFVFTSIISIITRGYIVNRIRTVKLHFAAAFAMKLRISVPIL